MSDDSQAMPDQAGKYGALCDFVREQTKADGSIGVVLLVVEEKVPGESLCAHASVQIEDSVKAQLPKMLFDLARRIESEQRIERVLGMVQAMRAMREETEH